MLQAGLKWGGAGWNTTTASRALYDLCQVPLVSSSFDNYRDAWVYGCALHWKVEIPEFSLLEVSAAAAFALASACSAHGGAVAPEEEEDEDGLKEVVQDRRFVWEEPQQPLPEGLLVLWRRFGLGTEKFEVRQLLERLPRYTGIPARPAENNHWQAARSKSDKSLKAQQQTVIHQMRLQAFTY